MFGSTMSHLYAPPTEPANPYAHLGTAHHAGGIDADASVTPAIREALLGTRPWVLLMSILGFIGAGFMILGAGGILFFTTSAMPMMTVMILVYVAMGVLQGAGSAYLFRYASSIGTLRSGGDILAVERALDEQRAFWKLAGIGALSFIALYVIVLIGTLVSFSASGLGPF
jgi:hypothetical protein